MMNFIIHGAYTVSICYLRCNYFFWFFKQQFTARGH